MSDECSKLVSIIVPVYQVEAFLDRCVRSLVNQTYAHCEIILVDDGSPDSCPVLCDEWAEKDHRIRVIHKINGGLSSARNAGLAIARGEYIAFVDSDDYVDSSYINVMVAAIERYSSDLVIAAVRHEDADGHELNDFAPVTKTTLCDATTCMRESISNVDYIVAWNKLYRRELWSDVHFPEGKINEDEFVFHQIVRQCQKICVLPEKTYHYIENPESITHKQFSLRNLDRIEARLLRIGFYADSGHTDLIQPTMEFIITDYFYAMSLPLSDKVSKQRLRSLGSDFRKVLWKIFPYITFRQKINCLGFAVIPVLYIAFRRGMSGMNTVERA